jgi:hypothetical protein
MKKSWNSSDIDLGAVVDCLSDLIEMMDVLRNDVYIMISKMEDLE